MMTDDLTAAVARLREDACTPAKVPEKDHVVLVRTADIRTVLAALAAAQADARRARECDLTLSRVLHELAGHASLCWSPKPTGVFDTGEALAAVESAINELRGILRGNAAMKGEGDA